MLWSESVAISPYHVVGGGVSVLVSSIAVAYYYFFTV